MLGKLLKSLGGNGDGRKAVQTVAVPDISRIMRTASPPPQPLPAMETALAVEDEPAGEDAPVFDADPQELVSQAETAVDSLADEFEGWMRSDLEKLRAAWAVALEPAASADEYRAVYTCAHNIRGAAASYGYPAVSRLCGSLCALLSGTRPGENTALINLHIEACRAAVAAGPQGEGSESVADAVCEALERRVAEKVAAAG